MTHPQHQESPRSGARHGPAQYHLPHSAEDLTEQNVRSIVELERAARASRRAS